MKRVQSVATARGLLKVSACMASLDPHTCSDYPAQAALSVYRSIRIRIYQQLDIRLLSDQPHTQ